MRDVVTLRNVALGVWVGGMGIYAAINETYQYKFRNSAFVQETLRVLKGYPHIEDLLGEDVQQCRLDLSNDFTKKDPQYAQIVIPVKGSKGRGRVYSWTSRKTDVENKEEIWQVDRLDLSLPERKTFTCFHRPGADYTKNVKSPS